MIDLQNFTLNETRFAPICVSGLSIETKSQLEGIIYTDFFNKLIDRLYWFIIAGLVLNFYIYWKQKKYYNTVEIKIKLIYVIFLFMQMGVYISITYLKFLIFYNWISLLFFFIILLPFFLVLNHYTLPIVSKIIDNIEIKKD